MIESAFIDDHLDDHLSVGGAVAHNVTPDQLDPWAALLVIPSNSEHIYSTSRKTRSPANKCTARTVRQIFFLLYPIHKQSCGCRKLRAIHVAILMVEGSATRPTVAMLANAIPNSFDSDHPELPTQIAQGLAGVVATSNLLDKPTTRR